MNREDISRIAKEAGIDDWNITMTLIKFGEMVAEHERELCMKAIEDEVADWDREAKEAALEAAETIRSKT